MGQYWRTVNIDKRERIPSWDTKLGYYGDLPNALPIRVNSLMYAICHSIPPVLSDLRFTSGTATGILHLPNKVIEIIFDVIVNTTDAVFLGLTCQTLWNIGRMRLQEEVQEFADGLSWAGDRVICVGDYQEGDDLPPGLLSEEETAEFSDPESDAFNPDDGGTGLYSLKCHSVDIRLPSEILVDGFHNSFAVLGGSGDTITKADFDLLGKLCDRDAWNASRTEGLYVLRNLSHHIVVLERSLFEFQKKTTVARFNEVKLGHLALMRICWSSDPSVSMSGADDIYRGNWAGDRFDIVSEKVFWDEREKDEVQWMDGSDDIVEDAAALWAAQNF
ncbi:hypothetical protein B0H11DRAFT_1755280 [Mycena galericulata]|nr:hypothetical protein B0H11DRAFT_1755280 [Mycena galericulata]